MQGMLMMLKAFGLDPVALQKQAEDYLKEWKDRFEALETHAASLTARIEALENSPVHEEHEIRLARVEDICMVNPDEPASSVIPTMFDPATPDLVKL